MAISLFFRSKNQRKNLGETENSDQKWNQNKIKGEIIDFNKQFAKKLKEMKQGHNSEKGWEDESDWFEEDLEGELSVDVYQTPKSIVIKSTIAGVRPEDLDISVNHDMVTIRGKREQQEQINPEDCFCQECYWGNFSRSIILPQEVKPDKVEATLESGVLTLILPKVRKNKARSIKVRNLDEDEKKTVSES